MEWPALLSWVGGVTLIVLAVVVGFALWMSGGRNESVQQQGFTEFNGASLLISEGVYPQKVWPKDLPVALVRFQRFGRSVAIFGGIGKSELRRGPGYDPTTPMVGELGNAVFIGKSSTYGSPFADLDQLLVGDQLIVESGYGALAYRVTEVLQVDRNDPAIYEPVTDDSRLSLVGHSGHPLSSERVLVRTSLDATGVLGQAALPTVPPSSSTGFAPLLVVGLLCCVAVMVALGEQVLPQYTTARAARWIVAPLLLAIAVPLAEQILLFLPRTW
ncbi:MAG: sortase [Acidimicrobiales bacterium]